MRAAPDTRSELRFVTCGSVDDGKSTLIGRLIHDATKLHNDEIAALREDSARFGSIDGSIDFALLLDGLEAEREQAITIDVAHRRFSTARRTFIVADTPGHQQYTRNMATGASNADLAVLLLDASKGVLGQTKRHASIVALLGIRHIVVAVNKIDLVGYSEQPYREIESAFAEFAAPLGFNSMTCIPLSALHGDNVACRSNRTAWYQGSPLLTHLETIDLESDSADAPLRFPVQWVNRPDANYRGYSGTVASGLVAPGDPVVVTGTGHITRVERISHFDGDLEIAAAGRSVTLVLADEVDVARGDMLADPRRRPIVTRRLAADLFWMADDAAIPGTSFLLKLATTTAPATLTRVVDRLDFDTLRRAQSDKIDLNQIGRVWIETAAPVAFDPYSQSRPTGGFILIDRRTRNTIAAGMAVDSVAASTNVYPQASHVTPATRAAMKGQRPLVAWLTGLPGAGKSTIADLVERKLVARGRQTMLLDGDNLRQGINADLGFDIGSRSENVRRVGELAKLMADAGLIVIVALVSPFRNDRRRAAALMPEGDFLEILVDAPVEVCRQRDTKGLYARADRGQVVNLTGRDQAYEPPIEPALVLRTVELTAEEAADQVVALILSRI